MAVRRYNQGYVTSRDRSELREGELQTATGILYKPGDPTGAHKIDGRSALGDTGEAVAVKGVFIADFDTATKKIIYLRGDDVGKMNVDGTGVSLVSLLAGGTMSDVDGTHLSAAHAADEWYFCTGYENYILDNQARARPLGLESPESRLDYSTVTSAGIDIEADAPVSDGDFTDTVDAHDDDFTTYAYASLNTASSATETFTWTTADTGSNRELRVTWRLRSSGSSPEQSSRKRPPANVNVNVKFEKTEDVGAGTPTWTEMLNQTLTRTTGVVQTNISVTDALEINANLGMRVTFTYNRPLTSRPSKAAILQIYEVKVVSPGGVAAYDFTNLKYAMTEFIQSTGEESAPGEIIDVGPGTDIYGVTLTLPSTEINSNTTHYRIYRTADNGEEDQLGLIATIPDSNTTFTDNFELYAPTDQPEQLLEYLVVTDPVSRETIATPLRAVPPAFHQIAYFDGSLVGVPADNRRRLSYTVPGDYTAWPENLFVEIPTPEHDQIQDIVELGGSLIIATVSGIVRLDELPFVIGGRLLSSKPFVIPGAPGCVGPYALTHCNFQGASHAAWISEENGIYVTDGHRWQLISKDLQWSDFQGRSKATFILHWIEHMEALLFSYDTDADGLNDEYLILHMSQDHIKEGGQAKITGPHYGDIRSIDSQLDNNDKQLVVEGHISDGKIYRNFDDTTGADASMAYNDTDTTSPMILKGPRTYNGWRGWSALDGRLYHSSFGAQTATLTWRYGRDTGSSGATGTTKDITVSLNGNIGTQFGIIRSGEWHEENISHTGTGRGAIYSLYVRALQMGPEGEQS